MTFNRAIRLFAAMLFALSTTVAAGAEETRIVAFGDSLMAGYRLSPGEDFPARLEAALQARGHDVTVANAGVSGDTTSAGLARLDWSVPDGTDLVILGLGANDMLRGIASGNVRENLAAILDRLEERGIDVILAGMLAAPNLGSDYAEEFNAIYPDLAEARDLPLYPFFLDGVTTVAGMTIEDGMHPSAAGVEHMVEGMLPLVEDYLATMQREAARDG